MLSILSCSNLLVRVLPVLVSVDHEGDSLLIDLTFLRSILVVSHIDLVAELVLEDNSLEGRADWQTEALDVSAQR